MNSQDLSGLDPFSVPFMGVIQELDDSLAAAGQSMQQQHTSWVFMEQLYCPHCRNTGALQFTAASLLSLLSPHLEDLAFPLYLFCQASKGQGMPKANLDQQIVVVVGDTKQQSLKCHFAKHALMVPL